MKFNFLLIITFISTVYAQQSKNYFNSIDNIALAEKEAHLGIATAQNATAASGNFDVKYYRCEWQVDPAVRYITGKVTSYFKITSSTDFISFDLMDSLIVDSVTQQNNQLSFEHINNTVTIHFGTTKAAGLLDSVSIYYQGVPPGTGFGSFVTSAHAGIPYYVDIE